MKTRRIRVVIVKIPTTPLGGSARSVANRAPRWECVVVGMRLAVGRSSRGAVVQLDRLVRGRGGVIVDVSLFVEWQHLIKEARLLVRVACRQSRHTARDSDATVVP